MYLLYGLVVNCVEVIVLLVMVAENSVGIALLTTACYFTSVRKRSPESKTSKTKSYQILTSSLLSESVLVLAAIVGGPIASPAETVVLVERRIGNVLKGLRVTRYNIQKEGTLEKEIGCTLGTSAVGPQPSEKLKMDVDQHFFLFGKQNGRTGVVANGRQFETRHCGRKGPMPSAPPTFRAPLPKID